MQDLASFTSHHLAYRVVYLSAESFMTREAVKVSFADCLDVAANEKTLISQLLQLCLDVPKALSILLLFKKSGNSFFSLYVLPELGSSGLSGSRASLGLHLFQRQHFGEGAGELFVQSDRLLTARPALPNYPEQAQQALVLLFCCNSQGFLSCPAEEAEQYFFCVCVFVMKSTG